MSSEFAGQEAAGTSRLPDGAGGALRPLYGQVYFTPESAFDGLSAAALTTMVLRAAPRIPGAVLGPAESRNGSWCAAQFAISTDPPDRFDIELSMREPLELQVWPDGTFSVEIEFTGPDPRTERDAGQRLAAVLGPWASARGWRLLSLYSDRSRSLPEVWNASFLVLDPGRAVTEALEFGRRAIAVAEAHRYGGQFAARLVELLRAGDAVGLVGTPLTAVFQPRPEAPSDAAGDFRLALDVCAFANAANGGLLVLGLEDDGTQVTGVRGGTAGDKEVIRVHEAVRRLVFPVPEGVLAEAVPSGTADGQLVIVHVPPQEELLRPFIVSGTCAGDQLTGIGVTLAERREATVYAHGIAALHSQIAAGRALLAGQAPSRPPAGARRPDSSPPLR